MGAAFLFLENDVQNDMNDAINISTEILAEVESQRNRWGTAADDTVNTPNDFVSYISHHASRWFPGGFAPYSAATLDAYRAQMVKVAALAVSAIASLDRQRAQRGTAFFEANSNG